MATRVTCGCGWTRTYATRARAEANIGRHVCRPFSTGVRRARRSYRCRRCGFEATYEDAGAKEAQSWFVRHSCRKQEEKDLRAAVAEERLATVDRTPQPCLHKEANHQHGTPACYVLDRCRCEPCTKANREAAQWRSRQKAYGRYNKYVPAEPVREHVRGLMDAGMGLKRIVKVAGVSHGGLWKLVYGKRQADGTQVPSRRVLRSTAEKLYALDPDWTGPLPLADGVTVDAIGTTRRLQALVALGWSMTRLGRRLGMKHPANVIPLVKGDRDVTVRTRRQVAQLYEELSMKLPPETNQPQRVAASRARNYAKRHGWLPPLAWDDADLDNPEATPGATRPVPARSIGVDHAAIQRRLDGDRTVRLREGEAAEVVRRARARGITGSQIEEHLGLKPERYGRAPSRQAS